MIKSMRMREHLYCMLAWILASADGLLLLYTQSLPSPLMLKGRRSCAQACAANAQAWHVGKSVCASPAWAELQTELDTLPVFTLVNAKGDPLVQQTPAGAPVSIFFADLFRAEAELANANRLFPDLKLKILPIGLGDAFKRAQDGSAMLVPSANELAAAGMDPATSQSILPLFGCTKLMGPKPGNPEKKVMPLFMSATEAKAAVDKALEDGLGGLVPEGMTAQAMGFDILCMPLIKACELIVTGRETRLAFIAPSNSVKWLAEYAKRTTAASDGSHGSESEDAARQAIFESLLDMRKGMQGIEDAKRGPLGSLF